MGFHGRAGCAERSGRQASPRAIVSSGPFCIGRIQRQVQQKHVDPRFAEEPHCGGSMNLSTSARTWGSLIPRAAATRAIWNRAAAGLMCGSTPLAEANTKSAGTGESAASLWASRSALALLRTSVCNCALVGP